MLMTPVSDIQTRRYICWDRAPLVKFNQSVSQICDISGLREVHAFEKVTALYQTTNPHSNIMGR
jgi:hypothetical protein